MAIPGIKKKNSSLYHPLKYISWHQNTTTTTSTIAIYCTRSKNNSFALVYTEYIKIMNSAFKSITFFVWLSPLLCVGFAAVMLILFWRFKWVYLSLHEPQFFVWRRTKLLFGEVTKTNIFKNKVKQSFQNPRMFRDVCNLIIKSHRIDYVTEKRLKWL